MIEHIVEFLWTYYWHIAALTTVAMVCESFKSQLDKRESVTSGVALGGYLSLAGACWPITAIIYLLLVAYFMTRKKPSRRVKIQVPPPGEVSH